MAVPLTAIQERFVVNAMTFDSPGPGDSREVHDLETGSRWAWDRGIGVEGPLEGHRLEPLSGTIAFWAIWARHYPETRILVPDGAP